MFERFTDGARRVVVLAQEEARMLNHNYIGTEHILLGLIHDGDSVVPKALESVGISVEAVRSQVEEIVGQGKSAPAGYIPFTARAKKIMELSLREALQLGHNHIGTEHILLGLISEGEGVGAQALQRVGADLNRLRQQIIGVLERESEATPAFIREIDEKIAHTAQDKDAALDEGDVERAVRSRAEERRLLEEKASREQEWKSSAEEIDQKIAEVRTLKEAAIDERDFERTAGFRDKERRLLEEKASLRRRKDLSH